MKSTARTQVIWTSKIKLPASIQNRIKTFIDPWQKIQFLILIEGKNFETKFYFFFENLSQISRCLGLLMKREVLQESKEKSRIISQFTKFKSLPEPPGSSESSKAENLKFRKNAVSSFFVA